MAASADWMEEQTAEQSAQRAALLLKERMKAIIGRLEREAEDRVTKRGIIEKRWLEDLAQYHGKYDETIQKDLRDAKKSTLFMNQTRPKTNAMEARLSDMLFPTDDRNWGIGPTPVPELTLEAEQAAENMVQAQADAQENPDDPAAQTALVQAQENSRLIQARMDEARRRARAMEEEIEDHLTECNYSAQAREVIRDACKLGTGIMKGPIVGSKPRRTWTLNRETGVFELGYEGDTRPAFWRVDPWHFFPDMDVDRIEDGDGEFERHLMKPKALRRFARQKGVDKDAVRRLLNDTPRGGPPTHISELRSITGAYQDITGDHYTVWEYHGVLDQDDLKDLSEALDRPDVIEDIGEEIDPLQEVGATIWFCQGEILKFGLHHLDSGDPIYSVFCLEKDESGIFGFGVPYIMRDPQKALNGGWRVMMDNAGLSSGPQIVIDENVVEPADGEWTMTPRKIWLKKSGAAPNAKPFETFNIESYQAELANIITMAKQSIDEETAQPQIAQGEQGAHITKTAHGMSILMNSVNIVFRRVVKNWDDDMTTPNIRRAYDFLMQFSNKQHIKGDYEVDARGTSVLLVREMQSANLMGFLLQFGAHPTLGKFLKDEGLPALRQLVKTMMISADELIKSNDDLADEAARAASQPPQPQPEIMKIEAQMNLARMEAQNRMEVALIERETKLMELAARGNMTLEQLREKLEETRMKIDSDERKMAAEAALTSQQLAASQPTGGGHF